MRCDSILDSRFHIRHDLSPPLAVNSAFKADSSNVSSLVNQLLLYERLVIPTLDFGIVPILFEWIGQDLFLEALEARTFTFVKFNTMLVYMGNGHGISMIRGMERKPEDQAPIVKTAFGDLCEALEAQLAGVLRMPFATRSRITAGVLYSTISYTSLPKDSLNIEEEAYRDILEIPEFKKFILKDTSVAEAELNLKKLPGIDSDQIRIGDRTKIKDSLDLVIRVAEINLELGIGTAIGNCDLSTSAGAEAILMNKLMRIGAIPSGSSNFGRLLELNRLPDIGKAVADRQIQFSDLWNLRNSAKAVTFRKWFRESDSVEEREIEREYVASLSAEGKYERYPARIVRFVIPAVIDLVNPPLGTILSAFDTFLIEKGVRAFTPRIFLDELRRLPRAKGIAKGE